MLLLVYADMQDRVPYLKQMQFRTCRFIVIIYSINPKYFLHHQYSALRRWYPSSLLQHLNQFFYILLTVTYVPSLFAFL